MFCTLKNFPIEKFDPWFEIPVSYFLRILLLFGKCWLIFNSLIRMSETAKLIHDFINILCY